MASASMAPAALAAAASDPVSRPAPPPAAPADPEAALDAALALYAADRVLDASRAVSALAACATPAFAAAMAADARVAAVRADMAEVSRGYDALGSEGGGWVKCYDGGSTTVEYRPEPDKVSHTMRATGVIRAPLRNVAALLNEADLFPEVFWFVTRSVVVGQTGRFRRAADITIYSPPPLYDRSVCLFGYAVDALDNDDCVLVVSRDRRPGDCDVAEGAGEGDEKGGKTTVQALLHYSMFELRPVSPDVTKVRLIANSDPRLAYMPMLLINWGSRMIMRFALRVLETRARAIDDLPHAARLNNPVYHWIDARLCSYWGARGYTPDQIRAGAASSDSTADFGNASDEEFDADARPAPPSQSALLRVLTPTASLKSGLSSLRRIMSRDR